MKQKCTFCKEESRMQMGVPMMPRTESGQLIDCYANKTQHVEVCIPLCMLHLFMAERGLVYTDGKTAFCDGKINYERFKDEPDAELRAAIRDNKDDTDVSIGVATLRAMLDYRKFKKHESKVKG